MTTAEERADSMQQCRIEYRDTCDWCGEAGELVLAPDGGKERLCERCAATFPAACVESEAE